MDKKKIINDIIAGEIPQSVPYYIDLTQKGKKTVSEYYGVNLDSLEDLMGNHLLFLQYSHSKDFVPEKFGMGLIKDEFGVTWDLEKTIDIGDWGMVDHPVKKMDLNGYVFPEIGGKGRFDEAENVVKQNPNKFNLLQMLGIFEIPCHIAGMEDVLVGMGVDENFVNKLFDRALEFNSGILNQLPSYIDGVRFIEDWGYQKNLIMGSNYWRKYLKPRLKIMYDVCRKNGCAVFIHSCGNITELIPDLIEMGVDVIDPIQPEVMDLKFIKREYGKDIVLLGGIGIQSTLPYCTPKQVVNEAKRVLSFMNDGGKFIFGPSGAISNDTPIENIVALIEFCNCL